MKHNSEDGTQFRNRASELSTYIIMYFLSIYYKNEGYFQR